MPLHSVSLNQSFSIDESLDDDGVPIPGRMKGKVMYDYSANGPGEISVFANEVNPKSYFSTKYLSYP